MNRVMSLERYHKNRDKILASRRAKSKTPEEIERRRLYRRQNRDKILASSRLYRRQPHVIQRTREYDKQNKRTTKATTPTKAARLSHSANRRCNTKERGKLTAALVQGLLDTIAPCALCGKLVDAKDASLDHVKPLVSGGNNDIDNVQILHLWCNLFKSDLTNEEAKAKYERIYA